MARTVTQTYTLYTFEELDQGGQQTALEQLRDINTEYNWWEHIYEDAEQIGAEIRGFNLDRGSYCHLSLSEFQMLPDVCENIKREHGEGTDTYKLAVTYLDKWAELVKKYSDGKNVEQVRDDYETQEAFDNEADELTEQFTGELADCYLDLLRSDYDYLISDVSIMETIEANEYEFHEDGRLA